MVGAPLFRWIQPITAKEGQVVLTLAGSITWGEGLYQQLEAVEHLLGGLFVVITYLLQHYESLCLLALLAGQQGVDVVPEFHLAPWNDHASSLDIEATDA